ncbi:alpha/beta hydrolase [Clostridium sp. D2Q-11]|uniref:Alpha/beta hydrolase n=1 Tax=Anaeromonas frigoriresistens TaxID=2683708 RepID=A0A942UXH8_9FIRM|nr:alpha/beta hydrolase [Anaeromonas frigoriresistens]MBS4538766.1 alpha/beta hydrolase [Anaeromonas frigoriresistens]
MNIENSFYITGKDNYKVYVYCWDDVVNPKGVIHIFHGMAEHAERYKEFAEYLNNKGFIVYANDHRGHGKTAGRIEELGYIGEDGFNNIVEDQSIIKNLIRNKYPELPIIVFGHSFGSFIAQEYIIRYGNEIQGVILSGSAMMKGVDVSLGRVLSSIERKINGDKKKSNLINNLSFGTYNKKINDSDSLFAWLTSDEKEVKKYDEDPYCGTVFTTGFFYYFFTGLSTLYKKKRLDNISKELPILILSGKDDPVGKYGKSVRKLYESYMNIGIENVDIKLYEGGRHEMINEINKNEVFEDIVNWITFSSIKESKK